MAASPLQIAVAPEKAGLSGRAAALAKRLRLPCVALGSKDVPFLLTVTDKRLELRQTGGKAPGPVFVDFVGGPVGYRRKHGGGRGQALARAVGVKGDTPPTVFDATAGLGRDAFILACLGCRVHLFERSPVIFSLLEDGINRALAHAGIGEIVRERMTVTLGDGRDLLRSLRRERPEVIFLDPMYPHRVKSALVKKEMRLLRAIVGEDEDAPQLLAAALCWAGKRVVVKRPRQAPALAGPEPDLAISGKSSRFDIYLVPK